VQGSSSSVSCKTVVSALLHFGQELSKIEIRKLGSVEIDDGTPEFQSDRMKNAENRRFTTHIRASFFLKL
jgi:hypothetical protein